MVLRLTSCSPVSRAFLPPSQATMRKHQSLLDASVGASGPHDFAVRIDAHRLGASIRPSHPALHVRDDRDTPLFKRGGTAGISNAASSKRRSEIFFVEGLDIWTYGLSDQRLICPSGKRGRIRFAYILWPLVSSGGVRSSNRSGVSLSRRRPSPSPRWKQGCLTRPSPFAPSK